MITERAMLAAIHISIWTAVKHDRKVSHEVASQHEGGPFRVPLLSPWDVLAVLAQRCDRFRPTRRPRLSQDPIPRPLSTLMLRSRQAAISAIDGFLSTYRLLQ
jgi:hypothetical protein